MTGQSQEKQKGLSDSRFSMWRCVIALAHADGKVQSEERAYLEHIIKNMDRVFGLTPGQKQALARDLESPQDISSLLPGVTVPQDRSELITFARLLIQADGKVTAEEEEIFTKLRAGQMASLDIESLRAGIRKELKERAKEYDAKKQEQNDDSLGRSPVLKALDKLLKRAGIDLLD